MELAGQGGDRLSWHWEGTGRQKEWGPALGGYRRCLCRA